jgi:hypothetical protein
MDGYQQGESLTEDGETLFDHSPDHADGDGDDDSFVHDHVKEFPSVCSFVYESMCRDSHFVCRAHAYIEVLDSSY